MHSELQRAARIECPLLSGEFARSKDGNGSKAARHSACTLGCRVMSCLANRTTGLAGQDLVPNSGPFSTARSTGGSACSERHFPAQRRDGTPKAMSCCPSGMSSCPSGVNSTRSANGECSRGINSTPHAMNSTRSAIHWFPSRIHSTPHAMSSTRSGINWSPSGIHSTSTPINSTRNAMNVGRGGVGAYLDPIHSRRSANRFERQLPGARFGACMPAAGQWPPPFTSPARHP